MSNGFVSDVDGDDTVMDEPHVTVSIDLKQLPPEQAFLIAKEAGLEQQEDYTVGQLAKGNDRIVDLQDAEFHLPIGVALTALDAVGVIDIPNDPNGDEDQ